MWWKAPAKCRRMWRRWCLCMWMPASKSRSPACWAFWAALSTLCWAPSSPSSNASSRSSPILLQIPSPDSTVGYSSHLFLNFPHVCHLMQHPIQTVAPVLREYFDEFLSWLPASGQNVRSVPFRRSADSKDSKSCEHSWVSIHSSRLVFRFAMLLQSYAFWSCSRHFSTCTSCIIDSWWSECGICMCWVVCRSCDDISIDHMVNCMMHVRGEAIRSWRLL